MKKEKKKTNIRKEKYLLTKLDYIMETFGWPMIQYTWSCGSLLKHNNGLIMWVPFETIIFIEYFLFVCWSFTCIITLSLCKNPMRLVLLLSTLIDEKLKVRKKWLAQGLTVDKWLPNFKLEMSDYRDRIITCSCMFYIQFICTSCSNLYFDLGWSKAVMVKCCWVTGVSGTRL